ncbi:MAG: MsnO8 family LLM class oxidoreductase [Corynebacterium sp.]|uniref:MsnO8 family LLM class oxidoreductase n=1 Tax=unclassified Corynebacterium TaxID=2624378 RepID=UPI00264A3AF1|nr:MsnO8 family LLM class oxidoreductase [Corynebacterium sp.]MDN5583287.1 MsnO8 family LLM class oxidoreductase [Corynebacterium sp.]MDN5720181.1 MsnO8 family LLM class oxidoreductase [Corynebacterium sp.]MDN6258470.1 MsnO8 family LLM class oxidoreductase [Corynebacterium sp.]
MRYSLLDRANTVVGTSDAAALRRVVERAGRAEALGYHRFLVAEHHGVPGIAGSAPGVLAAAVGQATSTVRVGTAGFMVPDHAPIVVAEQAAVLAALFPGRVDIGLGSSVGFTGAVRRALRQPQDAATAREGFAGDLDEVLGYLRAGGDGAYAPEVTMRPALATAPPVYLLTGGSPRSLALAARHGLGVILGGPDPGSVGGGEDVTVEETVVSRTVAVAPTREAARDLVLPEVWAQVMSRSTGAFMPLRPVAELDEAELTAQQRRRVGRALENTVFGTAQDVSAALHALAERTGASEILVTGGASDPAGQERSDALLAGIFA